MYQDFMYYQGTLDRKKMSYEARCAYEIYHGQRKKCNNPNNKWFKYYGGKGLKVEYQAREFVGWWLHHLKEFKGTTATTGRIDHNQGYNFSNIEMQDMADNSRESMLRNKTHIQTGIRTNKKIKIICKKSGECIAISSGIRPTADLFGVNQRLIHFILSGKNKNSKKVKYHLEVA